jgi:class 3 adenylate cyclase/tetratricopeptide (TPR) repeat protein
MRCPHCQQDNPVEARFCNGCGTRLQLACPSCGHVNPSGSRFCNGCGTKLGEQTAAGGEPRFSSPESYTPKHLADKILTSKAALEGERKQVTVLFCDVVESTRLSEQLGPEGMHELMDRALRLMAEAVHRYQGTVNQFLGDGLMALFGAPVALEDHALRAVHAALAIRETIDGLNAQRAREGGVGLRLRIGLNTGLVVVGKIGDDLRMDYTAIGDTTHLAARMQQAAEPGTILVAAATHRLVEGHVRSEPLGPVVVKGLSEPVAAYRIVGRRRRTRLEVRAERGLTRLVGRRRELDMLRDQFQHARAGRGQVVGIIGDAGIGKSRLLWEFRAALADERVVMLAAECLPEGRTRPYAPIIEILRSAFHVEDGDNPLQVEEKLRHGVEDIDPALGETAVVLHDLFALAPDPSVARLDPKARRQKTYETIRALLAAASTRRPHLVIVEDLHWIDETSDDYLAFFVESVAAMSVMLVTTSRPGHRVRWADRGYFTQIALSALDEAGTDAILTACLGAAELPAGLARLVHDKAEGNPLFVEEIARSLVERGTIIRRNGGLAWAGAPAVDFPAAGQDIIRARVDRLPEPSKRTLQAAAVIGREFVLGLLARVADTSDVPRHLETLKGHDLIHETHFVPEVEYSFKHALVQDVVYGTILAGRRRELHAAVGRALEESLGERAAEQYDVLAHHFSQTHERDKAADYLIKAGTRASTAFANAEARAFYERALTLIDEANTSRRLACLEGLMNAATGLGEMDMSLRHAETALQLAERIGDRRKQFDLHMHIQMLYTGGHWDGAREDRAIKHLEAAAALADADTSAVVSRAHVYAPQVLAPQKGLIYQRTAHLYLHRGDVRTARVWAERASDLFARLDVPMGTCLGTTLMYSGLIDEGLAYTEQTWPIVEALGNPLILSIFAHEIILALVLVRDVRRAIQWGERILPEVLKVKVPWFEAFLRRPLALAYTLAGDRVRGDEACEAARTIQAQTLLGCYFEDGAAVGCHYLRRGDEPAARSFLEAAIPIHEERNNVAAVAGCSFVLGSIELAQGRHDEAAACLTRSLDICRAGGNVLFELWILPALAELYVATGRPAEAAECVDHGFALMVPDRTWCGLPAGMHLARGRLARERHDWDTAEASFERAVAINREYGLPWDEATVLAEWGRLSLVRGAREHARERFGAALTLFERIGSARDAAEVRVALEPLHR